MTNLLIRHAGRTAGPYTAEEVRGYMAAGRLASDAPAWTEGLVDWSTVGTVLDTLAQRPSTGIRPPFTDLAERWQVPDGVRGFSWGALLLAPIWSIGNRAWIGLLAFVPGLGQLFSLWLGFHGRELAWRATRWQDVAHFRRVQRRWTQAALGTWALVIVLALLVTLAQQTRQLPTPLRDQPVAAAPAGQDDPPAARQEPAQGLALPASRDDFERYFKNRSLAEVRAALGAPAFQKAEPEKNMLLLIYTKVTLRPDSQDRDDAALILFVNGRARVFRFKQANER